MSPKVSSSFQAFICAFFTVVCAHMSSGEEIPKNWLGNWQGGALRPATAKDSAKFSDTWKIAITNESGVTKATINRVYSFIATNYKNIEQLNTEAQSWMHKLDAWDSETKKFKITTTRGAAQALEAKFNSRGDVVKFKVKCEGADPEDQIQIFYFFKDGKNNLYRLFGPEEANLGSNEIVAKIKADVKNGFRAVLKNVGDF